MYQTIFCSILFFIYVPVVYAYQRLQLYGFRLFCFLIFTRCITITIIITDAAAVPKNKVVIAYTGFDDKQGLLQTLRQVIKTIKRRVSDGEVVITPIIENTTEKINSESNNAMEIDQQDSESNRALGNQNNTSITSSTSVYSLEGNALSPGAKKTRGRPRGGSNTSKDSNNNATSDKHQTVDVSVGSGEMRVRGRSRNSSAAENEHEDIESNNNSNLKHTTTTTNTTTTSPKKKSTTTTSTENNFIVPEEMITGWQIEALECSVSILSSQTDYSAASCTHVIVNANSNA